MRLELLDLLISVRGEGLNKLIATHPPLEERIAGLQASA
jgi:Zn-dependent protease with chaperone function